MTHYKGAVSADDYYNMPCYIITGLRNNIYESSIMQEIKEKLKNKGIDDNSVELRRVVYNLIE